MIPEGWTESLLGDLASLSAAPAKKSDGSRFVIVDMGSVAKDGSLLSHKMTDDGEDMLQVGDLVMPKDDIGGGQIIGKAVHIDVPNRYVLGDHVYRLRLSEGHPPYVRYAINSHSVNSSLRSKVVGSAQLGLGRSSVLGQPILFPPLAEQQAIAEALSDADALVESLDALIVKKRDMKQAAMQHFFNRSLIPDNENSLIRFGQDVSMKARIGWQGLTTAEYLVRGAFRLVTGTDIQGGAINWDTCWYVDKSRYDQDKYIQLRMDDVLVTKDGTIGKVGFIDSLPCPATLNSGVFVLRPVSDRIQARYLRHLMFSRVFGDFLDRLTAGSTITHLYQKDFETFTVVVPGVEEQSAIAEVLSDMDAEIDALVAQREKAELVKQGMMQELLSGRVRLA